MELGKPMLADNKPWDPKAVESNLPLIGSTKLDGIRMLVHDGVGYSRSLKPLPNKQLQAKIKESAAQLEGFDGEIIVGDATDQFCFKNSHRACMKGDLEANHQIRQLSETIEYDSILDQGFSLEKITNEELSRRKFVDLLDSYVWMLRYKPDLRKLPEWQTQRDLMHTLAHELNVFSQYLRFMQQAEDRLTPLVWC